MAGPLEGIKIIELTSVVLGPWAAQIMADMGADVIKIEAPFGESNRQLGASRNKGMAALYLYNNRNKRSLVLDLKQDSSRDALLALVKDCDVFLHNTQLLPGNSWVTLGTSWRPAKSYQELPKSYLVRVMFSKQKQYFIR